MLKSKIGKCYIYKRATLFEPQKLPVILDYTDGTEPFDCTVHVDADGALYHDWYLDGESIRIPLNVKRASVYSIVKDGVLDLDNGRRIEWEYIFGKFRTYPEFYWGKLVESAPYILIAIIIFYLIQSRRVRIM